MDRLGDRCASSRDRTVREDSFHLHGGISVVREIAFVREITFVDGHPFARTTHMSIQTRPVGRANLTIIESPLNSDLELTGGARATPSTGSATLASTSS